MTPQASQPPVFKSGVEIVAVDVQVVDRDGRPVADLGSDQFEVSIDGRRRRVATVDLVSYGQSGSPASVRTVTAPLSGAANERPAPVPPAARLFILAVDEHSFRPSSARAAMTAAGRFIDRLQPGDLVALYAYPTGMVRTDLTSDHAAIREALKRVTGLLSPPITQFNLSVSEVVDISADDEQTLATVVGRVCAPTDRACRDRIKMEAASIAMQFEMQVAQSLGGLSGLLRDVARLPGRKTVVVVSGGLFAADRIGRRDQASSRTLTAGREAAAANVSLYVLHLDTSFLDAFSADGPKNLSTLFRDSSMLAQGLDMIAGAAGGALLRVQAGTGDFAFDRVLRETSAYYLLGVETADADRDGRPHSIRVKVKRGGATVRSRTSVVIPRPRSPER